MTRLKKQRRMANKIVLDKTPKKQERLSDPDSYESRKKRAKDKEKKHQSVEAKRANTKPTQPAHERDVEAGKRGTRQGGRLAEKIRRLNEARENADDSETQDS